MERTKPQSTLRFFRFNAFSVQNGKNHLGLSSGRCFELEIEKSREIGFCFGVRHAIQMLERAAAEHGGIETLGAVVHNPVVIEGLARKGVRVINSPEEAKGKVVAISSHGVGPEVVERLQARGLQVVDATCPRVRNAQRAAAKLAAAGFYVIVFGDASHPEVKGVLGWAKGKGKACADIQSLPDSREIGQLLGVLSQTTQSQASFADFAAAITTARLPQLKELRLINTLCLATKRRQAAAVQLTRKHGLIIVVGGRTSANTRRLVEACAVAGAQTHLVETAADIQPQWLKDIRSVGVTAGTSTPDQAIDDVIARLQELSTGARLGHQTCD
ncbi:MAG: 4-hydroxy-3-methylbut-2-enyl diphosphate reductase [Chloroflexi bacterium]|nr:4-hydroxy-3-methylbut-2-enyl diphosphate reductase [Chloroflexota bacterium]